MGSPRAGSGRALRWQRDRSPEGHLRDRGTPTGKRSAFAPPRDGAIRSGEAALSVRSPPTGTPRAPPDGAAPTEGSRSRTWARGWGRVAVGAPSAVPPPGQPPPRRSFLKVPLSST